MTSKITLAILMLLSLFCIYTSAQSMCSVDVHYEVGVMSMAMTPGTPQTMTFFKAKDNPYNTYDVYATGCECLVIGFSKPTYDGKYKVLRLANGGSGTMPFKGAYLSMYCSKTKGKNAFVAA